MLKKNISIDEVKLFSSAVLPAVVLIFNRVLEPLLSALVHNSPSEHSQLMVPTSAQGTGYHVAPQPRRR